MADINSLKLLIDSYGVAVRAGAMTPCLSDEIYFRRVMDLPEMSKQAADSWARQDGVRHPITLKSKMEGEEEESSDEQIPPDEEKSDEDEA